MKGFDISTYYDSLDVRADDEGEWVRYEDVQVQMAALLRDAERYRWLRAQENDRSCCFDIVEWTGHKEHVLKTMEKLDRAVDERIVDSTQTYQQEK